MSAPRRVVSLVPSVTETLLAFGITPVACTRFCEQPGIPTVGGTKNPDVAAIVELKPDLVVVNDEENRREDAEALARAGVAVHAMSPRSVAEVGAAMRTLGDAVDAPVPSRFAAGEWDAWLETAGEARSRRNAFVAVWRRPWMSLAADTYGSSLLALLGVGNVFADAETRYPEVTTAEVAAQRPDLIVLPSEPYDFQPLHAEELGREVPDVPAVFVDGRDLFWWGIRTPAAAARLAAIL